MSLTLARIEFFDTYLTRRIEWHGPELRISEQNSKLTYFEINLLIRFVGYTLGVALKYVFWSGFRKIHVKSIFQYIIGPRKKYVPLDILNMCIFHFGLSGNYCAKDNKTAEEVGRLRRRTSSSVSRS